MTDRHPLQPPIDDDTEEHTGGCLCGYVRGRAYGKPKWVSHCHCQSCRRATASAFATFVGFDKLRIKVRGMRHVGIFKSSPDVKRYFCKNCGSPLAFEGALWPGELHIHVGILDTPELVRPQSHVNVRHKLPWLHLDDGLEQIEGFDTSF